MSCRTIHIARFLATALAAALLQAATVPGASALLPTHAQPRFHLQAIEVRGARDVSSALVVSESLLEAGEVYTESELRDAVRRILRLPFILEVDFALGRGRERGTYVLTVDVVEARRFFYDLGLEQSRFGAALALGSTGTLDHNLAPRATAGARAFLGGYGVLFAAAGNQGARIGYTRYNLFDRNVVLSVGFSAESCCSTTLNPLGLDPSYGSWIDGGGARSATLSVGVPLGAKTSAHGSMARRESDAGSRRPVLGGGEAADVFDYEDRSEERIRLAWNYDTTDDPVFPRQGASLVVAVDFRTLEADLVAADGAPSEMSSELLRMSVLGRRHWPFAQRHAFAAGLSLGLGRSEVEQVPLGTREPVDAALDTWDVTATIRHSMLLHEAKTARRFAQVYWHNDLEFSWNGTSPGLGPAYDRLEVATFRSAVVFRTAWGIVRLGLRWLEVGDVL